ncbi:ROK family protein [Prolixibacteraceae bacterium Z1-6]|uniref:ROK family protein n=1 Tax=Draconibacterium aestuarii TaxID=2998507 RepID=A0A9X3FHA4_9BACT|nr:ROK family protein [Prolixibacteraceae bacterium Z1-6]
MENILNEVIGVDLGGTGIKGGRIVNEQIVSVEKCQTPKTTKAEVVTDRIIGLIKQLIQPSTKAIGIGIPSVVDTQKGIVYDAMNIPAWKEVHLKAILEAEFNIPVYVNNDANCFAIGEKFYGEGKNYQNFVGLTLGTGLGAGIIQQGRLLQDANCGSGEFCVVPYLDADFESYCSGMFFQSQGLDGQELYEKAIAKDAKSLKVFEDFGFHIAQLIKLVVATIDPQMIVFGGSVAKAFHLFERPMYAEILNFAYPNSVKNLEIRTSQIANQAIYGAAALCY